MMLEPILYLLALAFLFRTSVGVRKLNSLIVKTDVFEEDKSNAFFKMPLSTTSPLMKDYVKVEPEPSFRFKMEFYCRPNDPRFCLMFDKKGNVVGTQISFLKSDTNNAKREELGIAEEKNFLDTEFFAIAAYSSRVYFVNPVLLTVNGRQNMEEVADGLWLYLNGILVEIPRQESSQPIKDFYKQGCYPGIGQHYNYKCHKRASCKNIYMVYATYDEGSLVSYGIAFTSKPSENQVDWFQKPFGEPIKANLPNPPACLMEQGHKYGLSSLNVYLVENPKKISCSNKA